MEAEIVSVLVVTKDSKISSMIKQLLIPPLFEVSFFDDFNEARRRFPERIYKIVIVDCDDGSGTDFAVDISESPSTVLLLAPMNHFDQISYYVEAFGVLTLTKPFENFYFYNMIKIALAVQAKVQRLMFQTIKLKEKMDEIRLVNRAKMVLMSQLSMTEDQAHHYIEKQSMDKGIRRTEEAEQIIKDFSKKPL